MGPFWKYLHDSKLMSCREKSAPGFIAIMYNTTLCWLLNEQCENPPVQHHFMVVMYNKFLATKFLSSLLQKFIHYNCIAFNYFVTTWINQAVTWSTLNVCMVHYYRQGKPSILFTRNSSHYSCPRLY